MSKKTREDLEKNCQAQALRDLKTAANGGRHGRYTADAASAAAEALYAQSFISSSSRSRMIIRIKEILNMVLLIGVLAFLGYVIFI